jgi:hypothetical protein
MAFDRAAVCSAQVAFFFLFFLVPRGMSALTRLLHLTAGSPANGAVAPLVIEWYQAHYTSTRAARFLSISIAADACG